MPRNMAIPNPQALMLSRGDSLREEIRKGRAPSTGTVTSRGRTTGRTTTSAQGGSRNDDDEDDEDDDEEYYNDDTLSTGQILENDTETAGGPAGSETARLKAALQREQAARLQLEAELAEAPHPPSRAARTTRTRRPCDPRAQADATAAPCPRQARLAARFGGQGRGRSASPDGAALRREQGRVRAMEVLVREKELEADRLRGEIARLGDEARARDEELLALEVPPRSPDTSRPICTG